MAHDCGDDDVNDDSDDDSGMWGCWKLGQNPFCEHPGPSWHGFIFPGQHLPGIENLLDVIFHFFDIDQICEKSQNPGTKKMSSQCLIRTQLVLALER